MAQAKPKIVFWKPGVVVRGTQVYLDANFVVGLAWPAHIWHPQAQALLGSLTERATGLVLSSLALSEAIYQLMRLEQKQAAPAQPETDQEAPADQLRFGWADRLDEVVNTLPNLRSFEPPDARFHRQVIRAVRDYRLDPTDAFHYTATRQLTCPIITNDVGFQKIPDQNLTVVTFF